MGPAFSEKTVKAQEYLMKRHVDLFISQVSQGSLLIVVVMNWCNHKLHMRVKDKELAGIDIVRW